MEKYWSMLILTIFISAILKSLFSLISCYSNNKKKKLPPGPTTVPVVGNLPWLRKPSDLRSLKYQYGPLFTFTNGSRPSIFVGSHSLAHKALVQNGAVLSDRPECDPTTKIFNSNQHTITSASHGSNWRLLRRNIASEIMHPARLKSYSRGRRWVLGILFQRFLDEPGSVKKVDALFTYAMSCLLVLMCFGCKLKEKQIHEIEILLLRLVIFAGRSTMVKSWPRLGKILFRKQWKEIMNLLEDRERLLVPLIRARIEAKRECSSRKEEEEEEEVVAYVDTLANLKWAEEKRELTEGEMLSLCSEFLNAGTETTSAALLWIMANLVKYPAIQDKVYKEIVEVVGPPPRLSSSSSYVDGDGLKETEVVKEEALEKMRYLKAVVLEALRRHPPAHYVLPHVVAEDVELDGYVVPKNATMNFMLADMGWNPEVWENPMEFRPERFLNGDGNGNGNADGGQLFDVTGSKEIKMIPFGAGRRICAGSSFALSHLEYFVANMVWHFEWRAVDGDVVDLTEKPVFAVTMKNPLRAYISPRVK